MSRIQLLPEEVASQVAAGEVVERPASVIKELIENSIDAHATQIEVSVRRGGISTMRVNDNGHGMDRDDAMLCLERHATSKIRSGQDLDKIATLGFRGEALPSIASVSRFRLATREHGAMAGTEVTVAGGRIESVRESGLAPGTQIEVRSLFYNLPARRKFLRTENTECNHIEHQLQLLSIGHPQIGFEFVRDDCRVFQLPGTAALRDRIRDLSGPGLTDELIEVPAATNGGIAIRGFIGKPGVSRSTRMQQVVFLNGRAVENSTISYALREGYHTALMKGQHPVTYLFVDMDPAWVDVNVHPAKREVRFRDPDSVRDAVVESIRAALESERSNWSQGFRPAPSASPPAAIERENATVPETHFHFSAPAVVAAPPMESRAPVSAPDARQQDFKIHGVLGKLYVLMENARGLVLVDQHAAHERILFEELRRRMDDQGVPAQRLLIPLTIQAGPQDQNWLTQNLATLQKMGIGIEPFGTGTFKIDTLPQFIRTSEPLPLLRGIIDELRQASSQTSRLRLGEDVIATTVCRHAVKANDYLREPELVRLIQDLLRCELPYCCPHGRPTMIQISYPELEKKFGRKA